MSSEEQFSRCRSKGRVQVVIAMRYGVGQEGFMEEMGPELDHDYIESKGKDV